MGRPRTARRGHRRRSVHPARAGRRGLGRPVRHRDLLRRRHVRERVRRLVLGGAGGGDARTRTRGVRAVLDTCTDPPRSGGDEMRMRSRAGLVFAAVAIAVVALAATAAARTTTHAASPITIGWAFDSKGAMAPFDGPALAAAQIRVKQLNAKGGVLGRQLQIKTCDTQGNKPAVAKACALKLLSGGANVIFTTCDVDLAAPVVQEAINRGVLAIAPCIGTHQRRPKLFGAKGKLAFSFGNVAQDEGSAMAQYARSRGWKSASLATNNLLVYFKNVVQAFDKRFRQLGGKIVTRESYQT